jgi:hypothetical protein
VPDGVAHGRHEDNKTSNSFLIVNTTGEEKSDEYLSKNATTSENLPVPLRETLQLQLFSLLSLGS